MRPYILHESNWKYIKEQKFDLAILPWGATEAHNYHLPYGTDVIEGEAVAAQAARKAYEKGAKVIVLPTIPFGVNTGQADVLLDMNINPSTQQAILEDVLTVLNRQGIKKLLLLNSHGGNNWKSIIREVGLKFPEMFVTFCNWFMSLDRKKYFEVWDGDHADELETSLVLHLRPDLVRPLEEAGDGATKKWKIEALNDSWAWAERQWTKVTESTGTGDPSKSTAVKGEKYFNDVTDKLAGFMVDLASADLEDMYE